MAVYLYFNEGTDAWVSKLCNSASLHQWKMHVATQLAAVETSNDCIPRLKAEATDVTVVETLLVKCRQEWR